MSHSWRRNIIRLSLVALVAGCLAGCELPSMGPAVEGTQEITFPAGELAPLQEGDLTGTPIFEAIPSPATATPLPELGPAETLGPITVESENFRTLEAITVHVRHGQAVSNITCTRTLQETAATVVLENPVSQTIDSTTSEAVYTFAPDQAGNYVVNCTGIATTLSGARSVSAAGTPFSVEAKG